MPESTSLSNSDSEATLSYVGPCPCCGDRLIASVPNNRQGRRIIEALKKHARENPRKPEMAAAVAKDGYDA